MEANVLINVFAPICRGCVDIAFLWGGALGPGERGQDPELAAYPFYLLGVRPYAYVP